MEELNKKLAEWAGFELDHRFQALYWNKQTKGWEGLPNFPNSLDACFKWLVPNLDCFQRNRVISRWAIKLLFDKEAEPALSLCLVIEKLIDGDKGAENAIA